MMPRIVSSTLNLSTSLVFTYKIYSFLFYPEKWMYIVLDLMLFTMFQDVLAPWNNLLFSNSLRYTFISFKPQSTATVVQSVQKVRKRQFELSVEIRLNCYGQSKMSIYGTQTNMSVRVKMAIRCIILLRKKRQVKAQKPHSSCTQPFQLLVRFLRIVCKHLMLSRIEWPGPMGSSCAVFTLRMVSLLRECQYIFQRTAATTITARASAMLPINSPRVMRLFYRLRCALEVVNDCCELLIIINDGGKDEDPHSHCRQAKSALTETYRIRINGETRRIPPEETHRQWVERKPQELLQRPHSRKGHRESHSPESDARARAAGKTYNPSHHSLGHAEPSSQVFGAEQMMDGFRINLLVDSIEVECVCMSELWLRVDVVMLLTQQKQNNYRA